MKHFSSFKLHGFVGTFLVKMPSAPAMGTLSATLSRFRLKWGVSNYPHLLSVLRVGRVLVFGGNAGLVIGLGGYDGAQYPTPISGYCFHVVGLALGA
jgi:hypothetical protein